MGTLEPDPPVLARLLPMKTLLRQHRSPVIAQQRLSRSARGGLTLLEILLASVILATALAVIGQQNAIGVQAAIRTQLETEAAIHCQNLLSRLVTTGVPNGMISNQPLPETDGWLWSATRTASPFDELQMLTVSVHKPGRYEAFSRSSLSRLIPKSKSKDQR